MLLKPLRLAVLLFSATARFAFADPLVETKPATDADQNLAREDLEFFEKSVRPVLAGKCYSCHSADAKTLHGELRLDSRAGVAAGGASGEVITDRDPDASRLIQAVRWEDEYLQMPPDEKLSDQEIAALERWVSLGAPDPREETTAAKASTALSLEAGRKWWSFQPVQEIEPPALQNNAWAKRKIDRFVLAKLEAQQITPSPEADRAVLLRRAYLDLVGLRPTYEQVQSFVNDDSPDAYERVVEELLASPHYGERWGRYWLDVVRYAEDSYTGEATTPPFPFAWRYRDWVIDAVNRDVPYDQFVKLQLAADLMPETERKDLMALGYLGAAPAYHKDGRLSKDVVQTLYNDDWDERVDTVTRGLLGLTVSCARCHDHKFDPIPTSDYYSLAGVFASTVQGPRPVEAIEPEAELRFMVDAQRLFYLSYAANLMRDDPGSKPAEAREKVHRFTAEMERIKEENAGLKESRAEMFAYLSRLAKRPNPYPDEPKSEDMPREERRGRRGRDRDREALFHAVYDAGFYVDGSDPDLTMLDIRPGEPRDLNVLIGGNVTNPGPVAPRGFLTVLADGDREFHEGSGRRELAERIFTDAAPLSARVIVNRVWGWHFGKPLVGTPSDFGTQGEPPTHPELLDDLAARFIENGYSLKWLHREIMLSATYRQASQPRAEGTSADPSNHLLWRMNPRRMDVEAFRDCLLQASGELEDEMGGPSMDLERGGSGRRTVYGRVSRGRLSTVLQLYDFPSATLHSPQRETTTSPLQQLFLMNSDFVVQQAEALARQVRDEPDTPAKVRGMYRRLFARDPTDEEIELAEAYLETSTPAEYAQALLATNEVIFWP